MDKEELDDGFGNQWDPRCFECEELSISIVRPGKIQCDNPECPSNLP